MQLGERHNRIYNSKIYILSTAQTWIERLCWNETQRTELQCMFLVYPLSDFSLALLSSICTRAQHCLAGCDCTFARQPLTRPRIVCCQPSRCRNVQPQANTNTWCKLGSAPLLSFHSDCATARQRLHFPLLCALSFRKIFSPSHVSCVCVCVCVCCFILYRDPEIQWIKWCGTQL